MSTLKHRLGIFAIITGVGAGCAGPTPLPVSEITERHFNQTATLKDDDLETTATISTVYGWQPSPQPIAGRVHDTYLKAIIDKRNGATMFQVFTWIRYPGDWRNYRQANYQTVDGLKSTEVSNLGQPQVDCSFRSVGCIYTDQVGFLVPEGTLRQLHAEWKETPTKAWRFKLKSKSAIDYDGEITVAEIGGILSRVDGYRKSKNLPVRRQE